MENSVKTQHPQFQILTKPPVMPFASFEIRYCIIDKTYLHIIRTTKMLSIKLLLITFIIFISKNDALDCHHCTEEKSVNSKWFKKDVNELLTEIGTIDNNEG